MGMGKRRADRKLPNDAKVGSVRRRALFDIHQTNGLNDHVFRNRAPLYMTRFDDKRGCLVRNEEIILVPELGARLGNFSVTDISPNEAVLTVAECMQPAGCDKYVSDNSIWVVRVKKG